MKKWVFFVMKFFCDQSTAHWIKVKSIVLWAETIHSVFLIDWKYLPYLFTLSFSSLSTLDWISIYRILNLPQVFIKSELKVGVIYVKENQYTEEEILDNKEGSPLFDEFLQILGEKVRLKGNYQQSIINWPRVRSKRGLRSDFVVVVVVVSVVA